MTDTTRRTLAEMNAKPFVREWCGYTLETRYAVGRSGSSRRGTSGAKIHLLLTEVVTAKTGDHRPGTIGVGGTMSIVGVCNQNGQHNGVVMRGTDTADVTCAKCADYLGGR
jgi:hypothetical protein